MAVLHINQENFEEIKANNETLLLDFFAEWCGPCRMVGPILEEIAAEDPDFAIGKINVDEEGDLAAQFGVMSIPTLVVLKNGEIYRQSVGAKNKAQILALVEG